MASTLPLTARQPRPHTPAALRTAHEEALAAWEDGGQEGDKPQLPEFYIAQPTLAERDNLNSLLFELGMVQVTRETIRNKMLDVAFDIYGEEKGEELGAFLEGFWQRADAYEQEYADWQEQEKQRKLDEAEDPKKKRDPYPEPEQTTTLRERIRAKNEVDALIDRSPDVRRLVAKQTAFGRENANMMARLHLRGWRGLKTQREAQGGPPAELVTEECAAALRAEIGTQAWGQLVAYIEAAYVLSQEEMGNLDSRPENGSSRDGLEAPAAPSKHRSGRSRTGGTGRKSSTTPAPAEG